MSDREKMDQLIEAVADCIVAQQGRTNRERARGVLAVIDAQGFGLVLKGEIKRLQEAVRDAELALALFPSVEVEQ